jgi:hypothetical protein
MNTPQHSPDQLDFGQVLDGKSATRTLSLTTNAPGYVSVTLPPGPFRVAEFREMGTTQNPSKINNGQLPLAGAVRSRIKYQEGQNGPFQWSMAPNTDMQIDVVFTPKAQDGGAAFKTATMNVTGPGPHGNWVLPVQLRGSLSAVNLTPQPPQPSTKPVDPRVFLSTGKPGNSSGASPAPAATSSRPIRLHSAKPVLVTSARNLKLAKNGIDQKMLSLLIQQKQVAMQERSAILAQPKNPPSSKPMSAAGNAGPGGAIAQPSLPKAGANPLVNTSPAPVANTLACAKAAPQALLFSVNGQKGSVVFTTDADNNLFTFKGCNFGDVQGSLHLYGGFAQGNVPFEIQFWNDTSIVARVQPDLSKELDRDNVNLVVVAGNGHQTQFQGYKFYAARQVYPLASIPNPSSKMIFGPPDPDHCEHAKNFTFMNCAVEPDPEDGLAVEVDRWGVVGDKGTDQLTISGMKPGFEISDVSLWISSDVTDKQGWSMNSFAENISVNYVFDWKNACATYGLRISATGPRGFDSVWK